MYNYINKVFELFINYVFIYFFGIIRNGEVDMGRSRLLLNGMVAQPVSEKVDDSMDSFWGTRENLETQARQHYLVRNCYLSEQNNRMPYPSVYGTHAISKKFYC